MGYLVEFSNGVIMVFNSEVSKGNRRRMVKNEIGYWRSHGEECHVVRFCRAYPS